MGAEGPQCEPSVSALSAKTDRSFSRHVRRPLGGRTKSLSGTKFQYKATRVDNTQQNVLVVPKVRKRYVTQEDIYHLLNDSIKAGNRLSPYAPLPTIGAQAPVSVGGSRGIESCDIGVDNITVDVSSTDNSSDHPARGEDGCEFELENLTVSDCAPTPTTARERTYNVIEPRFVKRSSTSSVRSPNDSFVFGPRVGGAEEMQGPIKLWDGANKLVTHFSELRLDTNKSRVTEAFLFNL